MDNLDISSLNSWYFDLTEESANYLLGLVLKGEKRATSSSLWAYELNNEPIPKVGDLSLVTYFDGTPGCVIRTTNVRIMPFKDLTFDLVKIEGEDDCLESWQKNHIKYFTEDGKETGYTFSEDMPVIFEEFELVLRCE